jgi:hypothetical protein
VIIKLLEPPQVSLPTVIFVAPGHFDSVEEDADLAEFRKCFDVHIGGPKKVEVFVEEQPEERGVDSEFSPAFWQRMKEQEFQEI